MFYRFIVVDMCDECRVTMLRNPAIVNTYHVQELRKGTTNSCEICGRSRVLTMKVLTDYRVATEDYSIDLQNKMPRSVPEGFALLQLKDKQE